MSALDREYFAHYGNIEKTLILLPHTKRTNCFPLLGVQLLVFYNSRLLNVNNY